MSRFPAIAAALLASLFAAPGQPIAAEPPPEPLTVTFVHPETYQDASRHYGYGSDPQVLEAIRQHLRKLVERNLPPGYTLAIEVLDVDLAGYIDWRLRGEVRVIRDVTWPRMTLRYALRHGDEIVASHEERINNMNFHWGVNRYGYSDPLRYEKAMLDDWFARAITQRVHG